jgi:hypothetical protein
MFTFTPEQLTTLQNVLVNTEVISSELYDAHAYRNAFLEVFGREPTQDQIQELRRRFPQGGMNKPAGTCRLCGAGMVQKDGGSELMCSDGCLG